jgi:hypothetical protein
LRGLCAGLLCAGLGASALAQSRSARPDANGPKRVDTSPFRRLDIGNLRVELMALNDEACPLQLRSGRVSPTAGRRHALWVDVKSVSPARLASFSLVTLVFDASGRLKETRDTSGGPRLEPQSLASLELSLDYSSLGTGDWLVVAVTSVARDEGEWRSDTAELVSVAAELLQRQMKQGL